MRLYKSLGPSEIRERIAKILYSITPGQPSPKLVFDKLENVQKEHWRQRAAETIDILCNIYLNLGPANVLHLTADTIWEDGDKNASQYFHDSASLLDKEM